MSNNKSSTSGVLLGCLAILTFPLWIGLIGGIFGLIMGAFGIVVGVIAAVFGGVVAVISVPFRILFGWGGDEWGWHPHFHLSWLFMACLLVAALVVLKKKNQTN